MGYCKGYKKFNQNVKYYSSSVFTLLFFRFPSNGIYSHSLEPTVLSASRQEELDCNVEHFDINPSAPHSRAAAGKNMRTAAPPFTVRSLSPSLKPTLTFQAAHGNNSLKVFLLGVHNTEQKPPPPVNCCQCTRHSVIRKHLILNAKTLSTQGFKANLFLTHVNSTVE